jgi:hypothetical protein
MEQQPEIKGRIRESDLNFLVTGRGRFRIMFPYTAECLANSSVLIPVEQRPHLVDRAVASAIPGIAGNRYGAFGYFERMQAVSSSVLGINVKLVLVLEAVIQSGTVVRFCFLAFGYYVNDPRR